MESGREFCHRSVLLDECIEGLAIRPEGIYVDGTAGGGGHSFEIAKRLTTGKLIAIDQDEDAIAAASARLAPLGERAMVVRNNFSNLEQVLGELGIQRIDGFLIDAGVSSFQLDCAERGFSYSADAPLDMRMDQRCALSAREVVNEYGEDRLRKILYEYGEERFSPKIAAAIVRARQKEPIETTAELASIIKGALPSFAKEGGHHPAKRSFQAIRIEVNRELDVLEPAIRAAAAHMGEGGRIAVITFHSLEDRIVKETFASLASGCICPRDLPICVCGKKPQVKLINRKPVLPSETELAENPRSRSAKLRVAEKLK